MLAGSWCRAAPWRPPRWCDAHLVRGRVVRYVLPGHAVHGGGPLSRLKTPPPFTPPVIRSHRRLKARASASLAPQLQRNPGQRHARLHPGEGSPREEDAHGVAAADNAERVSRKGEGVARQAVRSDERTTNIGRVRARRGGCSRRPEKASKTRLFVTSSRRLVHSLDPPRQAGGHWFEPSSAHLRDRAERSRAPSFSSAEDAGGRHERRRVPVDPLLLDLSVAVERADADPRKANQGSAGRQAREVVLVRA